MFVLEDCFVSKWFAAARKAFTSACPGREMKNPAKKFCLNKHQRKTYRESGVATAHIPTQKCMKVRVRRYALEKSSLHPFCRRLRVGWSVLTKFEVISAMSMVVIWVVSTCGLSGRYQRFGGK